MMWIDPSVPMALNVLMWMMPAAGLAGIGIMGVLMLALLRELD